MDAARNLKLLRRESGRSQKTAAADLNVSQGLLSHYENGAREPGLDFIVRACTYYGVTADFLLGRTMQRDGAVIGELYDSAAEKENVLKGSAAALMSKKLIQNSASLILDLAALSGSRALVAAVSAYLQTALYTAFRHIFGAWGPKGFFPLSDDAVPYAIQAEMSLAELRLERAVRETENPELTHESLRERYPQTYPSLLNILHQAGKSIQKRMDE